VAFHSLIVAQDGSLWVCGSVVSNCLGHDTPGIHFPVPMRMNPASFNNEAVRVASANDGRSVVVTASGALYTWGQEPQGSYRGLCFRIVPRPNSYHNISLVPQRNIHTGVPHVHMGCFGVWNYPLTTEELLAFVMCTHVRLGALSCYAGAPREVLECIRISLSVPTAPQMGRGLRDLLGI